MHLGKLLFEFTDDFGQHIARLGVRGGNAQLPGVLLAVLLGQIFNVVGIQKHALGDARDFLAWLG